MAMNPQMLYALLAMDSYHRGANGGLNGAFGPAPPVPASFIDGWSILEPSKPELSINTGFSATAYQNGSDVVIAYRGTDDGGTSSLQAALSSLDVANGNGIALGSPDGAQAEGAG